MPEPRGVLGDAPEAGGPGIAVPERGAWLRRGISRNGGPLVEDREVVWLQAGSYFADSRGFAGVTSFDGSRVRFHHLTGEPGEDTGTLRWDGVNLVEWGTNTDGSTFLEVWTPLPIGPGDGDGDGDGDRDGDGRGDGETGSWAGTDYHVVRVGRHVVHVDSHAGTYWSL